MVLQWSPLPIAAAIIRKGARRALSILACFKP
jgi:hypothetical protein